MEYLKSIDDPLTKINENNIIYFDLFDYPDLVFGNPFQTDKVNFCKYDENVQKEMEEEGGFVHKTMQQFKCCTCGNRIRFKTTSRRLILKVEFSEPYYHKNMLLYNSSGFDVYIIDDDGKYHNYSLIATKEGIRTFAKYIAIPPNSSVCIFLPNYCSIKRMLIGLDNGSKIYKLKYPKANELPILFYGNSITQGASASKSGNSFPNIVSRKLDNDIINLSMVTCCRGTPKTAEMIGNIKCKAIVIDYSRYAPNIEFLRNTHEKFYRKIREKHPDIKIIIMTAASFNEWKEYVAYDEVIIQTYENAIARGENTLLLNQSELFDYEDYDLVSIDIGHYTDYGMYKIADKLCELLTL